MINKILIIFILTFGLTGVTFSQNLDLNEYDILFNDSLICKTDFLKNSSKIDSSRLKDLTFVPISNGEKTIYYLSGGIYAKGEIKKKKEDGFWTYWHENGNKAREGDFVNGIKSGTHSYWYKNGNIRGVGNFKNDKYHGKWTMHKEDKSEIIEQLYKKGKLIKNK
jgi:hypothetical protein